VQAKCLNYDHRTLFHHINESEGVSMSLQLERRRLVERVSGP